MNEIACIILPTYNEAENLRLLLPQIFEQTQNIPSYELHVLVVDSRSPDGTAEVVKGFGKQFPNLHLLVEEKKAGLGEAYQRGIAHALTTLEPKLILEMDADLQHDPRLIPALIAGHARGFDMVIGSRFVSGASIPSFSLRRRMLSRAGNFLVRRCAGIHGVRDCTSGLRSIRASLLAQCELNGLSRRGYSFQSSLLFDLLRHGARVTEIPIPFLQRAHGESKLSFRDQYEFLLNLGRLFVRRWLD